MARPKHKHRATLAGRLARAKRKLAKYEGMLQKGEYLTAPERRAFLRTGRLIQRLSLERSKQNARNNPGKKHDGNRVFRSLAELPPGHYLLTRKKGSSRLAVYKRVARHRHAKR